VSEHDVDARVLAALERLEREMKHDAMCYSLELTNPHDPENSCNCTHGERLRRAIAQGVLHGIAAAIAKVADNRMPNSYLLGPTSPTEYAVAAFEMAVQNGAQGGLP
jgi:hypothetical protein